MEEDLKDTLDSGTVGGARRAMPTGPESTTAVGPLGPNQRWTFTRKREVALRLLRGEPMDALARGLGVEIHRLEEWKNRALSGIDASLRELEGDPLEKELPSACFGSAGNEDWKLVEEGRFRPAGGDFQGIGVYRSNRGVCG